MKEYDSISLFLEKIVIPSLRIKLIKKVIRKKLKLLSSSNAKKLYERRKKTSI